MEEKTEVKTEVKDSVSPLEKPGATMPDGNKVKIGETKVDPQYRSWFKHVKVLEDGTAQIFATARPEGMSEAEKAARDKAVADYKENVWNGPNGRVTKLQESQKAELDALQKQIKVAKSDARSKLTPETAEKYNSLVAQELPLKAGHEEKLAEIRDARDEAVKAFKNDWKA